MRAMGLLQPHEREWDEQHPDRHVQPKDPLPGDALDNGPADERAERDGEAADAAPRAERHAPALRRHRLREDRQRQRQHNGAAEALDRARRDQLVRRARQRSGGGGGGEDHQPDDKQPAPPEAVPERSAGQTMKSAIEVIANVQSM
jgi:hypothetical protein